MSENTVNLGPLHELPRNEHIPISSGSAGTGFLITHSYPTPPDINPTPFTKTTPRQRANKGAKWYSGVRKGRREW